MLLFFLVLSYVRGYAEIRTDSFSFSFEGKRYSGILDMPGQQKPQALIVLVPGSGKTNIVSGKGFYNTRSHFTEQGFACLVWDKAGCGKSEGIFNYNQSVQNSAGEVIAAIREAKARKVPGSEKIGLWGISRAGWICPLVIEQCPIAFWISVSGTDDKENFGYLLESNLRIEGRSEEQTQLLVSEWKKGIEVFRKGGSFDEHQEATRHLRKDSFWIAISGEPDTRESYERGQKNYLKEDHPYDKETGLTIYVPAFDNVLRKVNCPVLAISGEKDSQVDWRKTKELYENTIGQNPKASLTVKILPDCNHSMQKCKTGGYREDLTVVEPCTGYYDTMLSWLKEIGFGS